MMSRNDFNLYRVDLYRNDFYGNGLQHGWIIVKATIRIRQLLCVFSHAIYCENFYRRILNSSNLLSDAAIAHIMLYALSHAYIDKCTVLP